MQIFSSVLISDSLHCIWSLYFPWFVQIAFRICLYWVLLLLPDFEWISPSWFHGLHLEYYQNTPSRFNHPDWDNRPISITNLQILQTYLLFNQNALRCCSNPIFVNKSPVVQQLFWNKPISSFLLSDFR